MYNKTNTSRICENNYENILNKKKYKIQTYIRNQGTSVQVPKKSSFSLNNRSFSISRSNKITHFRMRYTVSYVEI
jgi:hypothetical protein